MKKKFVSIVIVVFLALAMLQAVPASPNLANPNKPIKEVGIQDRITDANIAPATVRPGGAITATGYVQWYCSATCNLPEWRPNSGIEVRLIQLKNGQGYTMANCTTDPNGHFALQCQAPITPGTYQYVIFVPAQGFDAGTYIGPWPITVS